MVFIYITTKELVSLKSDLAPNLITYPLKTGLGPYKIKHTTK